MRQFTFTDIHRSLGQVMDAAEIAPVMITKRGKPALVMMSVDRYESMTSALKPAIPTALADPL